MCYKLDMIVWYRDNKDQDMELYQFLYSDFFFFFHLYSHKQLKTTRTDILTTYNTDRQQITSSMYSCTENWPSSPFSKLSFSEVQKRVLVSFSCLSWSHIVKTKCVFSSFEMSSVLYHSEHRRVFFFFFSEITDTRH